MRSTVQDLLEFGQYGIAQEIRPTQIQLGTDIEIVLEAEQPQTFLAEGGTGIGKSFAYMIPALLMSDKRVVVSTAKKSLQHQLYDKDIPFLREKMGKKFGVCLYMGTNNYACWKMIKEVPQQDRAKFMRFVDAARNKKIPADLSRWEGSKPYWWNSISVKTCIRSTSCPHYKYCRPHPRDARVVIVNHHLLAIDILKGAGSLLGKYDILVIDEAHQAPEAFRSTYSQQLRKDAGGAISQALLNNSDLQSLMSFGTRGLININGVFKDLQELSIKVERLHQAALLQSDRKTGIVKGAHYDNSLSEIRNDAYTLSQLLFSGKKEAHKLYSSGVFSDGRIMPEEKIPIVLSQFQYLCQRLVRIKDFAENMGQLTWRAGNLLDDEKDAEDLEKELRTQYDNNFICTVNENGLVLQPVDIGDIVGPSLISIPKKLILSATLALDNDFSYIRRELGLNVVGPDAPTLTENIYPTPFKLGKQARLYIPREVPLPEKIGSPARTAWTLEIAKEAARLINMVGGDTFILFSARKDLEEIRDVLKDGKFLSTPMLVQDDDGDATNVFRKYMEIDNCTLLGLKSFWEGVDIPGDKLRLVIIPKLPFPVPTDPVIKSLSDRAGDNFFSEVFIPRMVFDLKQAAGRLIRRKTDYGVVAILDPRVWSGSGGTKQETHYRFMETLKYAPPKMRKPRWYGKTIIDSLGFPLYQDSFTKLQTFVNKWLTTVKER